MAGPLEGVRVLDLTRVWSGPLAARLLADLGAEVIKVEGPRERAGFRRLPPEAVKMVGLYPEGELGQRPWNRNGTFNDFSRNKLGLTLDLNTPQGIDVLKRLVSISDVVMDNYSPRVMPQFGLDYPALREINPSIIAISMPGFGQSGPYRDYVAYGTTLEPFTGLCSLAGYRGGPPQLSANTYPDPVAALNAAGAILLALWHRRRSGQGQFIDLSQAEGATCLIGDAILGYQMTGRLPERMDNRHPSMAPHGCYRCRGEDRWIAITVSSEEEWAALRRAMGEPPWASDQRFAAAVSRWHHQDELDRLIEGWTSGHEHQELMHKLQEAGVPCGAVLDAQELVTDPHLRARGFFWEIDHRDTGPRLYAGLPIRLSLTPGSPRMPAPSYGEHNEHVLKRLLGMSDAELAQLARGRVIASSPED